MVFYRGFIPSKIASLLRFAILGYVLTHMVVGLAEAAQPNIVFILMDDLDYRAGSNAAVLPRTTRRLGGEGATFTAAYTNYALCSPSRATMLTGRYSQNTGVKRNATPLGGFQTYHANGLAQMSVNVPLQQAGYRTALIGKFINGYPQTASSNYVPPGWTYWAVTSWAKPYDYRVNENGQWVNYGSAPQDYDTDVYSGKALNFIRASADAKKPFALFLWFSSVHSPVEGAPRHASMFPSTIAPRVPSFNEAAIGDKPPFLRPALLTQERISSFDQVHRHRLRSLQAVDEAVEAIYGVLQRRGLLSNTYIVFTSDNGFHLGEHRFGNTKGFAYEDSIKVPLLVRGPGVPAGRKVSQLVGNADFAPTFVDWADVTTPLNFDGRSFAPLITSAAPSSVAWRKSLPLSKLPETRTPTNAWPYIVNASATTGYSCIATSGTSMQEMRGVRTQRYVLTQYATGDMELYDTVSDPYELDNRICSAQASLRDTLRNRAMALATCRGATCRQLENAAVP